MTVGTKSWHALVWNISALRGKKCYLREGIFSPSGGLPSRCNYNEKNTCFVWLWCGTNYNWRIRAILSRSEIDSMMVADIAINPQVLGVTGRGNEESKTLGDYKKRPPGVFSGSLSYTFLFLYRVAQKLRYYFGSIYWRCHQWCSEWGR